MLRIRGYRALLLLCVGLCLASRTTATEVKWTPNESDTQDDSSSGSGPLPLSTKQREQLLQLEDVIRQSENPQATLARAAESNDMSPEQLLNMLQRNRSDMEQGLAPSGGGGGMSSTVGGALGKLLTALFAIITKAASRNPRAFAFGVASLLLLLMILISAPRTGLVLSNQRGFLSRGPTTILQPPNTFMEQRLASSRWQQREPKSMDISSSQIWKELMLKEDGTEWHSLPRKSELAKAATAQITIPISDFLEEDEDAVEEVEELAYNHAVDVLNSQKLTEYAPENTVRLYTLQDGDSGRKRFSVLVMKGLGTLGRYGLVPLQVTKKQESDVETSITLSALKGAHFAGQIHVTAEKRRGKKGSNPSVVIVIHLAIPKKAPRISKKLALKIVESMSTSIAASVRTRTRQSLARKSQSSTFKGKARARAEERRRSRFQKEKDIEEMAEDRRRRWQRNNPNAGRYTPSGDRQKSPNNC